MQLTLRSVVVGRKARHIVLIWLDALLLSGCGLIEIVFEPDIYNSAAASNAVKSLQVIPVGNP